MSRFITKVICDGTSQSFAIPGKSIDAVMQKIRKTRLCRNATLFIFISRKTGLVVDSRAN
jgi:hypothetical protein